MPLALRASFCLLTSASEKFAKTRSRVHATYCLRRADMALLRGQTHFRAAQWPTVDRVDVRFRRSKGDQLRKRAVVWRVGWVHRGTWAMVPALWIS